MKHRVLLIEDDPVVRQSLGSLINASAKLELVGSCGSVREANCLLALEPEFLLVDLILEDGTAFDFIENVKSNDSVKVLVISALGDEISAIKAVQSGADGYIKKEASTDEILRAFESVLLGESPMSPSIARHLLRQVRVAGRTERDNVSGEASQSVLTKRELQVLEALAQGLNYKEVARRYDLSHHTVAKYIKTIYRKLAVKSRAEAVVKGLREGLINPDTDR